MKSGELNQSKFALKFGPTKNENIFKDFTRFSWKTSEKVAIRTKQI